MGGTSKVRAVTRWIGPNEFVYEMYMVGADGKEFKSMEEEFPQNFRARRAIVGRYPDRGGKNSREGPSFGRKDTP